MASNYISTNSSVVFLFDDGRTYASLDNLLKEWYDKLCACDALYIAISRKAPRLIEYCKMKFGDKRINVISELAIPFVDISSEIKCVVLDEAVYHGTTFSKIYNMVGEMMRESQPLAMPLTVTREAQKSYPIPFNDASIIEKEDINFFIDTIISRFLQLGKPYDMEYPILYVDLDKEIDSEMMESITTSIYKNESSKYFFEISKPYHTSSYSREERKEYINYSFITEYIYDNIVDTQKRPSFSKVRFFSKGKRLCISPMAPYIINDSDLDANSRLLGEPLQEIWHNIIRASEQSRSSSDEQIRYQCGKSLAMMANYLLSYNMFLNIKESIEQSLHTYTSAHLKVEVEDLTYLLGNNLAEEVAGYLNTQSLMPSKPEVTMLPTLPQLRSIPYIYDMDYIRKTNFDNICYSSTLGACISNQFSAMHWDVEIRSRNNQPEGCQRLRFGESFSSLYDKYVSYAFSSDDLREQLHRQIDSRIDRGSVVPNYVRLTTMNNSYWTRLFRAGENEDLYRDQLFRILLCIIRKYKDYKGYDIDRYKLSFVVAILCLGYENTINPLFGVRIRVEWSASSRTYVIFAEIDGQEINLVELCEKFHLIKVNSDGFVVLGDGDGSRAYDTGAPLSEDDENLIGDACRLSYAIGDGHSMRYTDEFLNHILVEYGKLNETICNWNKDVREAISSSEQLDMDRLYSQFYSIYLSYPDKNISFDLLSDYKVGAVLKRAIDETMKQTSGELKPIEIILGQFYLLNLWYTEQNGVDKSLIEGEKGKERFIGFFSEEERPQILALDSLHGDELRKAILNHLV